jgi:hypothetical protein
MLKNLLTRALIYGYLIFVGYQVYVLLQTNSNPSFVEAVNNFEKSHAKVFNHVYQYLPFLAKPNLKYIKYPVALMAVSISSIFLGFLGVFAIAAHALYVYITKEKIEKFVSGLSFDSKLDYLFQGMDLEMLFYIALYCGIMQQVCKRLFGKKCTGFRVC